MSDSGLPASILPADTTQGPYLYLSGGFTLGQSSVPYFSVTMTAKEAKDTIRLPSEMPFSPERPIDLEELFQRELDTERVRKALVPYLRDPDSLRFFNSLTVALLPVEQVNGHLDVADRYEPENHYAPTLRIDGYQTTAVGQISLARRPGDPQHGLLAWNSQRTFPVVLDGQHRLAAIQHALADEDFPRRFDLEQARLSILFLVFDTRAGYQSPVEQSVLGACRKVFTDLNKYAKQVSRSRQYLLDQTDLPAACLRAVLEPAVEANPSRDPAERAYEESRLPLALIDWRGETAKFDGDSPYVTTILALHGVVDAVLDSRMPSPDDYEGLGRYVTRVTARLLPGAEGVELLGRLLDRLEQADENELPFSLHPKEAEQLAAGFRRRFGAGLVRPLVALAPYARLLDAYRSELLLGNEKEAWFSLDPPGRRQLLTHLEAPSPELTVAGIARQIKTDHLAFQVVFQRGALLGLHSLLSLREAVAEHWNLEDDDASSIIDGYVARWNARLDRSLGQGATSESAFVGAGIRSEGTIDFRKTRIPAIAGFMSLIVLSPEDWWKPEEGPSVGDVEEWLGYCWEQISPGRASGSVESLYSFHGSRWRRSLRDVLASRQLPDNDEASLGLGVEQIRKLFDAG